MTHSTNRTLAIVSGALANKPFNGGNAWTRLSWVFGLQRLGWEVLFLEEIQSEACADRQGSRCPFLSSVNLDYFRSTMTHFGLLESSALICDGGPQGWGLPISELAIRARKAQLLINLSGHLTIHEIKESIPCKVYVDDDPGFTQFWHASGNPGPRLGGHDFYFTFGQNIGAADCSIPMGEIAWRHTRPPVVLDQWPTANARECERFTTVASWRGAYGPVSYGGRSYGLKVHEFRKFLQMPRLTGGQFEIALRIDPGDQKDLDALRSHGWVISNPTTVAASPTAFRGYVQESGAEFSAAQGIYVETNSGWFSDRTVRYLASGRPALVQDTGLSRHYPVGEGLLTFRTLEEAAEGVARIQQDYQRHCRAARRVAEDYFDSDKVIGRLASEVGLKPV